MGRIAFPNLIVKNLRDMLNDLVSDKEKREECDRLIRDNRALMDEGKRLHDEKMNACVTEEQVQLLLNRLRG